MAMTKTPTSGKPATQTRLAALRESMSALQLDAYLIPSVDEHINEYLPDNKQRRAWISGFTGSAGDCLVTLNEARVFVDSRYYEQADYEVDTTQVHVSKVGLTDHPTLIDCVKGLIQEAESFRIGFDPYTLTVQQMQSFKKVLEHTSGQLVPVYGNLIDAIWLDTPPDVLSEVVSLPNSITGQSVDEKLKAVQEAMRATGTSVLPVTKLDQIAWLFNLRGQDIPYNPVFTAYAILTLEKAHLFIEASRIEAGALDGLATLVDIQPYEHYSRVLQALAENQTVLIDPKHTTVGTQSLIEPSQGRIKEADHPVERLKALKNETEIRLMKDANLKASRGKIRAWYWLEQQLATGSTITEASFRDAIERLYAEEEGFRGLSFNTISGAGANSSIVHYGTPNPNKRLETGELFLIDSGCQFYGGTTDDTRTWLVGNQATELQTLRYTEVLKAHINCAAQIFPKGTDGARLDGITRATLWEHQLDYGHGTGHGVGAFLNVHEGPNGIHKMAHKPLEPGMINSIEPGYYEPGWGGIRLENLYVVASRTENPSGTDWYGFDSLTFVPFDKRLIDLNTLNSRQLQWLREYHQAVFRQIGPTLPSEEQTWLEGICTF